MKYKIYIILFLLGFKLSAQIDCNSSSHIAISLEEAQKRKTSNNVQTAKVALFSQIDFNKQGSISIIYETIGKDSSSFYYSTDIAMLQDLANQYSNADIIQDASCDNRLDHSKLIIIEDKNIVHDYSFNKNCKLLTTDCGVIKFDIERIKNACTNIQIEAHSEHFKSEQELVDRLKQLSDSSNTILLNKKSKFVKGTLEFEFIDTQNKVDHILKDTFWLNMINEELSHEYENSDTAIKSEFELSQTAKILQYLVNLEYNQVELKVTKWNRVNNTNKYLIRAEYYNDLLEPNVSNTIVKSREARFELNYITKKRM